MPYTPATINSGDPITSEWGNKIEQELAKLGNYMGEVALVTDLPSTPEAGDFYLVQEKKAFYLWNGEKWKPMWSKTLLAANEDTITSTTTEWQGLKGFTLLNGSDPFNGISARAMAYVSPSGATCNLRLMIFDYSGDTALVTGSAKSVASTDPVLVELDPTDISTLTPSAAYTVSLQGQVDANVTGSSVSIIATEFYGE